MLRYAHRLVPILLLPGLGAAACHSSRAGTSGTGGTAGTQEGGMGGAGGAGSCGSVSVAGTTPQGPFAATGIIVAIEGPPCSTTIDISISDAMPSIGLYISLPLAADAGADTLIGPHTVSVGFRSPTPLLTPGVVTITAADDPRAAASGYLDGGIWNGSIAGSLTMSQDGFSLSGTFASSYCAVTFLCERL